MQWCGGAGEDGDGDERGGAVRWDRFYWSRKAVCPVCLVHLERMLERHGLWRCDWRPEDQVYVRSDWNILGVV